MLPSTTPVSRADIVREFGDLDDLTIIQILEVHPTFADLVEARNRLTDDGVLRRPPTVAVTRIAMLVRDALERAETEEESPTEDELPV